MTYSERLRNAASIWEAVERGANWEYLVDGVWCTPLCPDVNTFKSILYEGRAQLRLKPAPRMRDWNCPLDVPLDCWISVDGTFPTRVIAISDKGPVAYHHHTQKITVYLWQNLAEGWKYSTDRKTWRKCEVETSAGLNAEPKQL